MSPRGIGNAFPLPSVGLVRVVAFSGRESDEPLGAGHWRSGDTILSRLLGKELVVLAWAIEEADPALFPLLTKVEPPGCLLTETWF